MDSERESEKKAIRKPGLRRRLRLSFWLLLLLVAIIGWRVYLVRWPTEGPSWHGLMVGQSTTEDVIAMLGEPSKISFDLMTGTVYHYEDKKGESWKNPTIYFRNNQVIRIRIRVRETQDTTLWAFVDQYGKPDLITDEIALATHSSSHTKGVYWLDEGIYVSVLFPDTGDLAYASYFRPCPPVDTFCIMAEQWNYSGPAPPGEDTWGIMSPFPPQP